MASVFFLLFIFCVSLIKGANAWFRVACAIPLVHDRIDPIRYPSSIPSNHIHTVHGASNFAANGTYESLITSKCTSCSVAQDHSNYWVPILYFRDPKTHLFEQVGDGGLLVYYQNRGDAAPRNGGAGLKAFPHGLKMTSGDPKLRRKKFQSPNGSQEELAQRAIEWACLRYPNHPDYYGTGFPTTDCESGFNARIHMPACWDGVHLDSPDHVSHTAYLSALDNGHCPDSHPVPLMKLFYEVTWNIHAFASRWNPKVDSWPFVYSTGDPTGYSWHGDFQNGWDTEALQYAIDNCDDPYDGLTGNGITEACPYLTVIPPAVSRSCHISPVVKDADGTLSELPGCNPIQPGPEDAVQYNDNNCPRH